MKQTNKIILFILIVIGFQCFSQEQESIIYFKDGDSIEGIGAIKNDKIKFKISPESKADLWDFENVIKITFIGFEMSKTYEYVQLDSFNKPKLIELVVKGAVSLYKNEKTFYSKNISANLPSSPNAPLSSHAATTVMDYDFYYLKRNKDAYPVCINCGIFKSWAKKTTNFLSDCDYIVKKINTNEFSFKQIKEIVEFYNDICTE